ncbi:DUF669 domain-containing protein [Patescibacteria group bacterium]|nr:DUF669 domain-containing protein [Patescibacteria group bacterium]
MGFTLDLSQVDTNSNDFEPMPTGNYNVIVAQIERKESKAGNFYLKCELIVMGGEYDKRKVWENFTLAHEVGLKRFKEMVLATGMEAGDGFNPESLHGKCLTVSLGIEQDDQYGDKNKVIKFLMPGNAPTLKPVETPATKTKLPWEA